MTVSRTTMRAAVIDGPDALSVQEFEVPTPGDDEVLVKVEYCGICGTDLHATLEGWAAPGTVGGHEWSGRIAAVGSAVSGWSEGELVVGGPPWCGECEWCRRGRPALCTEDPIRTGLADHGTGRGLGAFAEYHLASAASVHRAPPGLDPRVAALSEPLAVALHALTAAELPDLAAGVRILVSGAGPLGLLVIAALGAYGYADLMVSEPTEPRRRQALAVGAARVVAPDELPAVPALPTEARQDGFDVVFETSGQAVAITTALGLLRPTGRLVLLGTGAMSVTIDPIRILLNELIVTGAYCYDDGGIDEALALLASGRLPIDALVGADDAGLDDLLDTMHRLRSGELATKALVRPVVD
jgi:(R,R)-butanediol dehydrogenase/meso-butanediol dehydrogenase/diacetyl reductase